MSRLGCEPNVLALQFKDTRDGTGHRSSTAKTAY